MEDGHRDFPPPLLCAHLLARVDAGLIELLQSLTPPEWDLQTVSPAWKVRDVAAHLLDTALRKLSFVRDSCGVEAGRVEIQSPGDVGKLVNRLNAEGVLVYGRLSPPVLIDLMILACEQYARFHESLDPFAPALFSVSWAGEERSLNWFDTARELTERWHHQQQIRLATDRPGLMTPDIYHPVLDCLLRGLPFHFRDVQAPVGSTLLIEIAGDCGGRWWLCRGASHWSLAEKGARPASVVRIPQRIAWRVFTLGITEESIQQLVHIEGNQELGERVLSLTSIVTTRNRAG